MPHSSGGGSHSGGSHSGGSSGGHSSRSSGGGSSGGVLNLPSNRRTSGQPFNGAKRYLYYSGHKPYFIYANYDIRKPSKTPVIAGIIIYVLFVFPFLIGSVFGFIKSFNKTERIKYFDGKRPEFIIEDNLGIFEDEKSLKKSMKAFYEETGIVPAVITVSNDTWNEDYTSLENYAYDVYVNRFPDEAHWLIVYSEAYKDNGFNDWYWEGMQGNRTDPVLTEKRADAFTRSLQDRLLQRGRYSVDQAIAATFDEYRPQMMGIKVNWALLIMCVILFNVFAAVTVYWFMNVCRPEKVPEYYKNAKPCDLTAVYQEPCNFCGGIYIIGMHTECPHCGGALPPHHYVKDAQGNVVQIM